MTTRRMSSTVALICLGVASTAQAQGAVDTARPVEVYGAVNVNSKGISTVPALTLGRPAAILDLGVRKGRIAFEPQFRFALDGKPWSFLLWSRYRAVDNGRFRLTLGGHPAYSFRARTTEVAGRSRDVIDVRRYFAADVTPTYAVTRHTAVGGYYLYSHSPDPGAPPHTQLVAARAYVADVTLFRDLAVQAAPQLYYLRTNGQDGTYVSASASIGRRGSPWSVSTIVNAPIRTEVAGGRSFLWNAGVTYAFRVR